MAVSTFETLPAPHAVQLWHTLQGAGWVYEDAEGALRLTAAGEAVLEATLRPPDEDG